MKTIETLERPITIESFGGTGGMITGSCHKIEIKDSVVMVDSGMYQGRGEERSERGVRRNFEPFKMAEKVTHIMETHSHIDHIGRLPMIFKRGFTPTVLATEGTAAFMKPMLYNSAEIQESENPQNRLYETDDVDQTLKYLNTVEPFKKIPIGQEPNGITAEFLLNGHVMGSSSIIIRSPNNKNILFTGDMGKPVQSLCGGYEDFITRYPTDPINTIVAESTNFDKNPVSFEKKQSEFLAAIKNVWVNGGNPVFPVLSFHRTQEIIEMIHNSQENGEIPRDCKIIIDAPLAIKLLKTFKKLGSHHLSPRYGDDSNFYQTDENSIARFNLKNLTIIKSHEDSVSNDQKMAEYSKKAIILASGGMGGHGRSINYLKGEFCKNPKNAVVFTCYQAEGTEGAALFNKGQTKSGAKVIKIEGLTSHASGPTEIFGFLERFNLSELENVIITHGRNPAREMMASEFKRRGYSTKIILSDIKQVIEI